MSEMYANRPPKTRINLIYGVKIRYIKAVSGLIQTALKMSADTYTNEEVQTIERILADATERAKKTRDEEIRREDTVSSGTDQRTAQESRQYTGK